MARRYALPFRAALASDVELGAWHYEKEPGLPVRLASSIPGWDYLRRIRLRRTATVHTKQLFASCQLPDSARIVLSVTVYSATARYRSLAWQSPAISTETEIQTIDFELESTALAGEFVLDTEVLLTTSPTARHTFVAHLPGSRLFSDALMVQLEGSASRMPVEIVKFSEKLAWLGAPRAPWYVSCGSSDMHAPVMREVRVYLNSEVSTFAEAARRADNMVVSLLGADASRHILDAALNDEEFLEGKSDYAEGTLGEAATRLVVACFGNLPPKDAKAMAQRDRARFDAIVQSVMNVTAHD